MFKGHYQVSKMKFSWSLKGTYQKKKFVERSEISRWSVNLWKFLLSSNDLTNWNDKEDSIQKITNIHCFNKTYITMLKLFETKDLPNVSFVDKLKISVS